MRNVCLAVGISDAQTLDFLPGAANGARAMAAWATASGYQTELLTDDEEPVDVDMIRDALVGRPAENGAPAVVGLLQKNVKTDRLLIYFAGHGLAPQAQEDLWLLSQWHDDLKAVAVAGLRRRLERYAIGQIVMVSDACRSLATDPVAADLQRDYVLGLGPFDSNLPRADIWKASSWGRAAYMIPGASIEEDRCIFSGLLHEALWGGHDAAFATNRAQKCITSSSLARFLEKAVPEKAALYGEKLNPDIVTGLRDDEDLYVSAVPPGKPVFHPWPERAAPGAMGVTVASQSGERRGWSTARQAAPPMAGAPPPIETERSFAPGGLGGLLSGIIRGIAPPLVHFPGGGLGSSPPPPPPPPPPPAPTLNEIVDLDRQISEAAIGERHVQASAIRNSYDAESERPTHFETGAGFSIDGARARSVHLGGHAVGEDERDGRWWRVAPVAPGAAPWWSGGDRLEVPLPLLVELEDGRWVGAAAIPDFVVSFTVSKDATVPSGLSSDSVVYRDMYGTSSKPTEAAVAAVRAGTLDTAAALDYAIQLRGEKLADPMLGVIAAYLYDARADVESIRQIAFFHAERGQAIPFDVALLGRIPATRSADGVLVASIPAVAERKPRSDAERQHPWTTKATPEAEAPVAGAFPWMRQGWSQIDDADTLVMPGLAAIARSVLSAPFTTLDADGGKRLAALLSNGGI